MSKTEDMQDDVKIGDFVTLRLTRGDDIAGRVAEVNTTCVILVALDGRRARIYEDLIGGWDIRRESDDWEIDRFSDQNMLSRIHEKPDVAVANTEQSRDGTSAPVPRQTDPIPNAETAVRRARIDAAMIERRRHSHILSMPINFKFPEHEFDSKRRTEIRTVWVRAQNQYDNALRVHEISRVDNIINQVLRPLLLENESSASLQYVIGSLYSKVGRQDSAIRHLRTAAQLSNSQMHWLCLAAASHGTPTECLALRNYLLSDGEAVLPDAWARYIETALLLSDRTGLIAVFTHRLKSDGTADREAAMEGIVHVLGHFGADAAADGATVALLKNDFTIESWRYALEAAMPSIKDTLSKEEKVLSSPPEKPITTYPSVVMKNGTVLTGRVTSFGTQNFGFIETSARDKFFFRAADVDSEALSTRLMDGTWRFEPNIEFTVTLNHGQAYHRACNVRYVETVETLMASSKAHLSRKLYDQALSTLNRTLALSPQNSEALALQRRARQEMLSAGIGLPKGKGPYAEAKRAELVRKDLDQAERLYRRAIEDGDQKESAVKDLATLLMRKTRFQEASEILENSRGNRGNISPYDNLLSTVYQQSGSHEKAISVLQRLLARATGKPRVTFYRRIAFSQFEARDYDAAELTLRQLLDETGGDALAERWLEKLEDARAEGNYDEANELIGRFGALVEGGIELTPLARHAIELCKYPGVAPAKVDSGAFSPSDVENVEKLAKELGTGKPRDRAGYYLSAAAMLSRLDRHEDASKIYDYLRRYFTSMGDAGWVDKNPADSVRAYYLESLALVSENDRDEAWRTLVRYLGTYFPDNHEALEKLLPHGHRIQYQAYVTALQSILRKLNASENKTWRDGLLEASSYSAFVRKASLDALSDDDIFIMLSESLSDRGIDHREAGALTKLFSEEVRDRARTHSHANSVCETLTRFQLTSASVEEIGIQLSSISKSLTCDLDKRRLIDFEDVIKTTVNYCQAYDFETKEQSFHYIHNRSRILREVIRDTPTQFSHASLLAIINHLDALAEEHYAHTVQTAAAKLNIRLLTEYYTPDPTGEIRLQIEVSNEPGSSPASNISINVGPTDSSYFNVVHREHQIATTIRGGSEVVTHLSIRLREGVDREPAFPITVTARYRNRVNEEIESEEEQWTIRLYKEGEFEELENPYAAYAEGGEVDSPKMFVGRDELLSRLPRVLTAASGKCIVMFGQKRAGKSSLLEHLRRALTALNHCVAIKFSIYDLGDVTEGAYYRKLIVSITRATKAVGLLEHSYPDVDSVLLKEMPTITFHEYMEDLLDHIRASNPNLRVVLLIDEFTEIYKRIIRGSIPPEFMKAWKSIVEKRYFASVLVGQDIMPAFKAAFPNEFGVTEDVRVTYLSDDDSRKLIERIGADRFLGNAVTRIIDLTAGSPYYIMMLCDRLVDYMNRTRSSVVTEADIQAIVSDMISGDSRLASDKFDNLITAGDGPIDSGIAAETTLEICEQIARGGQRGWCSFETLQAETSQTPGSLEALIIDLDRRDVIASNGRAYKLRVGLFRDWLQSKI